MSDIKIEANGSKVEIKQDGSLVLNSGKPLTFICDGEVKEIEAKNIEIKDKINSFEFSTFLQKVELNSSNTNGIRLVLEGLVYSGNKKIGNINLEIPINNKDGQAFYDICRKHINKRISNVSEFASILLRLK